MRTDETNRIIAQMMGGDVEQFLTTHWRRRIMVARNSLPELSSFYSLPQFVEDYCRVDFHAASSVIDIVDGQRRFTVPKAFSDVSQALKKGSPIVMQALRLPIESARMPERWRWMLDLYSALCKYFLPGLPTSKFPGITAAAVDIFCAMNDSTTGGHHDGGDVFFLPLDGPKEWTVEFCPDMETVKRLCRAQLLSKMDLDPANETTTVVLYPGDCLYMPPYTYHRARATGPSLGVSFGLPSFNAINLLAYKFYSLARQGEFIEPLPSAPKDNHLIYIEARAEQRRRLQELLETMLKQLDE
ncbi:MAG: JmjC domain-containing protein [Blastocatellia bacterium]